MTEAITEDAVLGGRVTLRQPREGFRVAIDSILLAAAVPADAAETVLDVGAGVGAAAICLAHRIQGEAIVDRVSDRHGDGEGAVD